VILEDLHLKNKRRLNPADLRILPRQIIAQTILKDPKLLRRLLEILKKKRLPMSS